MLQIIKRLSFKTTSIAILFLLVQSACALLLPFITTDLINNGILNQDSDYIIKMGLIMIALSIISLVGAALNTFVSAKISYRLSSELREEVYRKVLSFSSTEFDKVGTASLIIRNTNDINKIQNLVEMGLKFLILAPIYLIGGILLTYLLNPKLSLIFIAVLPIMIIAAFVVYRFVSPLYEKIQSLVDKLNLIFREGLTGVKVIRAFTKEETEFQRYKDINKEYTKTSITAETIMSIFIPFVMMLMSLTNVTITWLGAKFVASKAMEIGTIMGCITYGTYIMMGFGILTNVILAVPRGQISAQRVNSIINTSSSIVNLEKTDSIDLINYKKLSLNDVSFRYDNAAQQTLKNITFEVEQNQTLAIIGSTGDGKSTLINLISRFYDVNDGSISIDGIDVRNLELSNLHDLISLSPQISTLFHGTIRSNMLIGKPDASDEEIWNALEMADALEFVSDLDNEVEKNGNNFSGGQRQRLCIARTLIKDAKIYIFDDSFSALDFKTDNKIRQAMKVKLENAIIIIVAQRISTVMNADNIVVIDNGSIVGLGKHDSLKENCIVYQEIVKSQFNEEKRV